MHEISRSTINHQPLPVVIDMTLYFAFIKSDSRLFIFHRFKQRQRLPFAHLAFFLLFSLAATCSFLSAGFCELSPAAPLTSPANFFCGDSAGVGEAFSSFAFSR